MQFWGSVSRYISYSFRCLDAEFFSIAAREIFTPILESRRSIIAQTAKETFQYGPTERHKV